jgi:hypothetical protein
MFKRSNKDDKLSEGVMLDWLLYKNTRKSNTKLKSRQLYIKRKKSWIVD